MRPPRCRCRRSAMCTKAWKCEGAAAYLAVLLRRARLHHLALAQAGRTEVVEEDAVELAELRQLRLPRARDDAHAWPVGGPLAQPHQHRFGTLDDGVAVRAGALDSFGRVGAAEADLEHVVRFADPQRVDARDLVRPPPLRHLRRRHAWP